jgi:molybdenum cofactor synthesis domain-containing protein
MSTAALCIIGDEVLSGKVAEENAAYLIRALRARGVALREIRIVGDHAEAIGEAVRALSPRVDHVLTTGGIGPTHDDITMASIASAFSVPVVQNPDLVARLRLRYGEPTGAQLRLAEMPDGAEVLWGGGPIPTIRYRNIFILPGIPSFMRACFQTLAPLLGGAPFFARAFQFDRSETSLAHALADLQGRHPAVSIGSYPRHDDGRGWWVRITLDGRDDAAVRAAADDLRASLEGGREE